MPGLEALETFKDQTSRETLAQMVIELALVVTEYRAVHGPLDRAKLPGSEVLDRLFAEMLADLEAGALLMRVARRDDGGGPIE